MATLTHLTTDELIQQVTNDPQATEREQLLVGKLIETLDEIDTVVEEIRKHQGDLLKDSTHGANP